MDEVYQDDYYPDFLVDKVKDELQKVIDLLESGETDTEVIKETLDEAVYGIMIDCLTRGVMHFTEGNKNAPYCEPEEPQTREQLWEQIKST